MIESALVANYVATTFTTGNDILPHTPADAAAAAPSAARDTLKQVRGDTLSCAYQCVSRGPPPRRRRSRRGL